MRFFQQVSQKSMGEWTMLGMSAAAQIGITVWIKHHFEKHPNQNDKQQGEGKNPPYCGQAF